MCATGVCHRGCYVIEFCKITHMGMREIIRTFMFTELLVRTEHTFENISLVI